MFTHTNSEVVARVQGGSTFVGALDAIGVPESTGRYWLTRGRQQPNSKYGGFASVIDAIREDPDRFCAEQPAPLTPLELLGHIEKAVRRGSIRAAALWLDVSDQLRAQEAG